MNGRDTGLSYCKSTLYLYSTCDMCLVDSKIPMSFDLAISCEPLGNHHGNFVHVQAPLTLVI